MLDFLKEGSEIHCDLLSKKWTHLKQVKVILQRGERSGAQVLVRLVARLMTHDRRVFAPFHEGNEAELQIIVPSWPWSNHPPEFLLSVDDLGRIHLALRKVARLNDFLVGLLRLRGESFSFDNYGPKYFSFKGGTSAFWVVLSLAESP